MLTSKEIKTKLKLQISLRSIRRILLEQIELKSYVAVKKPLLTKSLKQKRIKFAEKYLKWTPQMWRKCIFTDESSFETSIGCGYRRVRRKKGENRYQEKFNKKTTKLPPSVMIWACICAQGPGQICLLPPNIRINSKMYVKFLKKFLLPSMASLRSKYMFQDKVTPHTSKMTTLYLKESRIQTVTLPGSSPDINPIENCFSFVKSKLEKEDTSNLPKLRSCIRSKWNKLDRKYLEKLCLSMPTRLRDVLKRKGGMTKY
jgi:transposase